MSNFALSDLLDAMDSQLEKSASEGQPAKTENQEVTTATAESTEVITKMASDKESSPSEAGAALFQEIMQAASMNLEVGMNKQASVAGLALAQVLLKGQEKKAGVGDVITQDGVAPGSTPAKSTVDNAAMNAEGESAVKPTPTGNGVENSGSVNEIFDSIVADAQAQGAASTDQVHTQGVAAQEGKVEDHATPAQVKVAALESLLERGFDFDEASEMVKEADDHMLKAMFSPAWQENAIAKDHGKEGLKGVGANVKQHFKGSFRSAGRGYLEGAAGGVAGAGVGALLSLASKGKFTPKDGAIIGAIPGIYIGGAHGQYASLKNQAKEHHAKYASEQELTQEEQIKMEKIAAINELVANGINFEDAVEMVKQAEAEIAIEMEKSAALAELMNDGIDFDQAVELIKQASVGDQITADGVAPGSTPTKAIVDNAAMNAEGDSYIKPMVTGNGVENGGTVNEIFDALVSDTLAQGAASTDQVHGQGVTAQEGKVDDHATPSQVKVAYINQLLDAGVDFADAVALVKQAGIVGEAGKIVGKMGRMAGRDAKAVVMGTKGAVRGVDGSFLKGGRVEAAKRLVKNPLAVGGAAAAAGGAAYAATREKKAAEAVGMLVERGIAFEDAVSAVKEKSAELYGE